MREIRYPGRPFDLGQGWFRKPAQRNASPPFVEHLGSGGGFTAMRLYPSLHLAMVVMANTTTAYDHGTLFDTLRRVPWTRAEPGGAMKGGSHPVRTGDCDPDGCRPGRRGLVPRWPRGRAAWS